MATGHAMPYALELIGNKQINLLTDTFVARLMTSGFSTWTATDYEYQFAQSFLTAFTEVTATGYAPVTLSTLVWSTAAPTSEVATWNCAGPLNFGTGTISAASMIIYDSSVGSGLSTYPVVVAVDFGGTVSSTSAAWTYTINASGLLTLTAS